MGLSHTGQASLVSGIEHSAIISEDVFEMDPAFGRADVAMLTTLVISIGSTPSSSSSSKPFEEHDNGILQGRHNSFSDSSTFSEQFQGSLMKFVTSMSRQLDKLISSSPLPVSLSSDLSPF